MPEGRVSLERVAMIVPMVLTMVLTMSAMRETPGKRPTEQ